MNSVVDQAALWAYCFIAVIFVPVDVAFVAAALAALLYACVNFLMHSRLLKTGISAGCLFFSFLNPPFLLFTPFTIYGILEGRSHVTAVIFGALCFFEYISSGRAVVFFLMIGIMMAVVMEHQTRRYTALEERYRKTRDESAEKNLLLKEKNQSILKNQDYEVYTAMLRERNRIAREIHDNVGHMLSRAILLVGAMKAIHGKGALSEPMGQLEDTLNAAMTSVRESVHDLHDESVNLKEVLESLVGEFTFCSAVLEYDMGYDVPREIRYSFIAIVKEALHNVAKHSNAAQVRIVAREHPGLYQLLIEDDGTAKTGLGRQGMRGMQEIGDHEGIGLKNMKERVDAYGGNLEIRSQNGWRIYITVPKKTER